MARRPRDLPLFPADDFAASMESAIGVRRQIAEGPDDSLDQVRGKERTLAALESEDGPLARWREAADLWCAAWLDEGIARDRRTFGALLDHVLRRGSALPPRTLEPLLAHARGVSRSARVFNWAMEFPEVFYGDDGVEKDTSGFDVVLGNPPWDVLHETEGRDSERRLTTYARGSGQYGLQGSGHANLYQLFFERGLRLLKPGGRCALILPSGFATDQGSGRLRRHLLERTEVDTFATIDNRDGIFPIHRSLKFVLLTFNNGGHTDGAVAVRGAVGRVARLRPGQRRRPRGAAGAEIDRRAREWRGAGAARHPDGTGPGDSLEDHRPGPGERRPSRMAHPLRPGAERDRRPAALHEPRRTANSRGQTAAAFRRRRCCTAVLDPAGHGSNLAGSATTFGRDRLAYRDVASPTNRQTLIAAIVPRETVTTHTVFCVKETLDEEAQQFLCGMLNSYVADYLVRMRVGTHVSAAIVARLPVPRPDRRDPLFVGGRGGAAAGGRVDGETFRRG